MQLQYTRVNKQTEHRTRQRTFSNHKLKDRITDRVNELVRSPPLNQLTQLQLIRNRQALFVITEAQPNLIIFELAVVPKN